MTRAIRASQGICIALIGSLLAVMPVAAQGMGFRTAPDRIGPTTIIVALLAGALILGWLNYRSSEAFGLTRITSLPVPEIIDRTIGRYTVQGWRVTSQSERGVTMYRRSDPSLLLTLVLLIFGIVPGVLYLLLGGRDLTLAMTTRPHESGRTEVDIVGNGHNDGSFRIAKELLDALP